MMHRGDDVCPEQLKRMLSDSQCAKLRGIVSCDSAAIRIQIRIVR